MFGTTGPDPQPGFLTTTLRIPVLSWLYQLLFDQPLTIFNALTLVISIPVTIIWRIIDGQWPADTGLPTSGLQTTALAGELTFGALVADTPPVPAKTQQLLANVNLIVSIVGGLVSGVGDAYGAGDEPVILGQGALLLSVVSAAITAPDIFSDSLTELDWSAWGITVALALTNILSSISFSDATNATFEPGPCHPRLRAAWASPSYSCWVCSDPSYGDKPTNPLAEAALGINIVTTLPDLINPIRLLSETGAIVVGVLDLVMGIASGVATVLSVEASTEGASLPLTAGHPVGLPMLPAPN